MRWNLVFILIVALTTCSLASAKDIAYEMCNGILVPGDLLEFDLGKKEDFAVDHGTVVVTGQAETQMGEIFWLLAKLAEETSWMSRFSPRSFDPQGDPRWPLRIFGPELSRILGFTFNDQGQLLVPTAETLNSRLFIFNQFLISKEIAPIRVVFYSQQKAKILTFMANWARGPKVPVSINLETHTIHDISYHYSTIMMPDQILDLIQMEAQIFDELIAFTQYRYGLSEQTEQFLAGFKDSMLLHAQIMDVLATSANYFPDVDTTEHIKIIASHFATYSDTGSDSVMQHWSLISKMTNPWTAFQNRMLKYPKRADENLERLLFEFQQYSMDLHPQWHMSVDEMGLGTLEATTQLFANRSREIRQAAELFLKNR